MENNVILNKIAIIERCMNRIDEVYNQDATNLNDYTKQDSLILNLQRCCEASIDLAMHIVAQKGLGIPQTSREAFDLLLQKQMIPAEFAKHLKAIVGFRNIAVHDYQALNLKILQQIIENHLEDFRSFAHQILVYDTKENE